MATVPGVNLSGARITGVDTGDPHMVFAALLNGSSWETASDRVFCGLASSGNSPGYTFTERTLTILPSFLKTK
jgi:hypothetical protein